MILLKHPGHDRVAGNNHEGRSLERASPREAAEHRAELTIVLYAARENYRLLLTADDLRRIVREANRYGLCDPAPLPDTTILRSA